jgi:predicted unusual protein kinase regulating ubiquinone biosynthesis (AarF/ABC1/UbiB family)
MSEAPEGNRSVGRLRIERGLAAARLAARSGARYTRNAPRLFRAAGEQRQRLRNDLALQTAEDVANTLGTMKGVLMKLGQMASYVDDGLNPQVRRTLSRLQDSVPPMSPDLAAQVISQELGANPDEIFKEWDPEPIAAASIGQVHRAITEDGQAVAVKVQYPGIRETISADLNNVALLRGLLKAAAPNQDVGSLIEELSERIREELDYEREAVNQAQFAAFYDGHPTIRVPKIISELSAKRVITSELATGVRFAEFLTWPQEEKDLTAETIYRYVFRSLYDAHAFNGDPHPGNYLFEPGGKVTFLDYGLVKHFTAAELTPLETMVRALCVDEDPEGFRAAMVEAGFLQPDAPVSTEQVIDQMSVFYDTVRTRGTRTMTSEYSSTVARKFFDFRSPIAPYANIPRSYVIVQRINLGLFAVLAEMHATGDWRALAEEIWPFFQAPPSTPMGEAEAAWKNSRSLSRTTVVPARGPGRRAGRDGGRSGRRAGRDDERVRTTSGPRRRGPRRRGRRPAPVLPPSPTPRSTGSATPGTRAGEYGRPG